MDDQEREILTLPEITTLQANDAERLAQAARDLATARTEYEHFTRRGAFFSDEAHAAEIAGRTPALVAAETRAISIADSVERNARQVLNQARRASIALTPEEEAIQANRAHFAEQDAERLPLSQLRDQLAHALTVDDRPALALHLRYTRARLRAGEGDRVPMPGDEAAAGDLPRLLLTAADRLRDRRLDPVKARAEELLNAAIDLGIRTGTRRRGIETEQFRERLVPHGVPVPAER